MIKTAVLITNLILAMVLIALIMSNLQEEILIHSSASGEKTYGSPLYLLIVPLLAVSSFLMKKALEREKNTKIFAYVPVIGSILLQILVIVTSFIPK